MKFLLFVFEFSFFFYLATEGSVAFPDTCACPDSIACPQFCLECGSYDDECVSGKTNNFCNGGTDENCPSGYTKKTQLEVNPYGGTWSCRSGSYGWKTMYHCFRYCLGIRDGTCNKCQNGYYSTYGATTCTICPQGYWCMDGEKKGKVPAGYYSEPGSTSNTSNPCFAGHYGDEEGQTSGFCNGECQSGYWCAEGSQSPTQNLCNAGRWGGPGESNSLCSGSCSAGYYCPAGSSSETANPCGNTDVYCPAGSAYPQNVSDGYYSTPIEEGTETIRTGQSKATKGHYASNGILIPCPSGRYSNVLGATTCENNKCKEGFLCPEGSTSATAQECVDSLQVTHPAEYFCPEGTPSPIKVVAGYYTIPEDAPETQRYGQALADPSYTVKHGKRYKNVEWRNECADESLSLSISELTNHLVGNGWGGAQVLLLEAYNNMVEEEINSFQINAPNENENLKCAVESFPFEIVNETLFIKENATLNYENCSKYVFEVLAKTVHEGTEHSAPCKLTIDVINLNDMPYYRKGENFPYELPLVTDFFVEERTAQNAAIGNPIVVSDEEEGQEIYYEILDTLDGIDNMFYIGSCSGQIYVRKAGLDYRTKSEYYLQVRACDDPKQFDEEYGQCTPTVNITIYVEDINDPPSFSEKIVEFRVDENSIAFTRLTPYCDSHLGLIPCNESSLVVDDLDLQDNRSSVTDIMQYTIENENSPFIIVSCNRDDNMDLCSNQHYSYIAGTILVAESNTLNFEDENRYSLFVTVVDGRGGIATKNIPILIMNANDDPEFFVPESLHVKFYENNPLVKAEIGAIDEDVSDVLYYSVLSVMHDCDNVDEDNTTFITGTDNNASASQGETVHLTVNKSLDYETCNRYNITLKISDGTAYITTLLDVEVLDENEAPYILTTSLDIDENVDIGTIFNETILSEDPDNEDPYSADQTIYYSKVSSEPGIFTVTVEGSVVVASHLNFEENSVHTLEVRIHDGNGLSATETILINVNDKPDPPEIPSQTVFINESTNSSHGWSSFISVLDEDLGDNYTLRILSQKNHLGDIDVYYFSIQDNTTLVLNTSHQELINYEDEKRFALNLSVVDSYGLHSNSVIFVDVLDVNDPPVLSNATFYISKHRSGCEGEYCDVGTVVDYLSRYCTDEDVLSQDMDTDITYSILSGNDGDTFEIVDGVLKVKTLSSQILSDYEFTLLIEATDHHPTNPLSDTEYYQVVVIAENLKPVAEDYELYLQENDNTLSPPTVILNGVNATDPENTLIVYELIQVIPGSAASSFYVDENSGVVYLLTDVDFETMTLNGDINLTVLVKDNTGNSNHQTTTSVITIHVTDINEVPTASDTTIIIYEGTSAGYIDNGKVVVTDPDAADQDKLTFQLIEDDSELFSVNQTSGQVYQNGKIDFENPRGNNCFLTAGDEIQICTITIRVTDTALNYVDTDVEIQILNVNEPPLIQGIVCVTDVSTCSSNQVTLPESTVVGQMLFSVVSFDPDKSDSVKYFFKDSDYSGNTNKMTEGDFSLETNGNLFLANALDFENRSFYILEILVQDEGQKNDTISILLNVTDVNELNTIAVKENKPLPTEGGDSIILETDTNIASTSYKVLNEPYVAPPTVNVYLGYYDTINGFSPEFEAEECTVFTRQIVCNSTPPGVGHNLHWQVVLDSKYYSNVIEYIHETVRYEAPNVTSVQGASNIPTDGGTEILVFGNNFPPMDGNSYPIELYYRTQQQLLFEGFRATCSSTQSGQATCVSAEGMGTALEFAISVGGQLSAWYADGVFSYARPIIESVSLSDSSLKMSTRGSSQGNSLLISGENFGISVNQDISLFFGPSSDPLKYSSYSCNILLDHTLVQCDYPPGSGIDLYFTIIISNLGSQNSTSTLSYTGPVIFGFEGPGFINARTVGGDLITIIGSAFGPVSENNDIKVNYGGANATKYQATECKVVLNDTRIDCYTAPGTGNLHAWIVSVSGQASDISFGEGGLGTSYSPPTLNYFEGNSENAKTIGGGEIYLVGLDFGPVTGENEESLFSATYGPDSGDEYSAVNCMVVTSHTKARCILPPGVGTGLRWIVTVDGQNSRVPTTAYRGPEIKNLSGTYLEAGTDGGDMFFIHGFDFGPAEVHIPNKQFSVTYGNELPKYEAKNCSVLQDDPSTVSCAFMPGVGVDLPLTIEVAGQVSEENDVFVSYAGPTITSMTPSIGTTSNDFVLTVEGLNFGTFGTASVFFNSVPLDIVSQIEHRMISVSVPGDMQRNVNNSVEVFVAGQNVEGKYSFNRPLVRSIAAVDPPLGEIALPQQILIRGSNFGTGNGEGDNVTIAGHECLINDWSHTYINCNITKLSGDIEIVVGSQTCEMETYEQFDEPGNFSNSSSCCPCGFDYEELLKPPKVTSISKCGSKGPSKECHTSGGYVITVYGSNLGTYKNGGVVIGESRCEVLGGNANYSEFEINCVVPEGEGVVQVYVRHAWQVSAQDIKFYYDGPEVYTLSPSHGRTIGGYDLLLSGNNFGTTGPMVFFHQYDANFTECPIISFSHHQIICRVPEGQGDTDVFVTVANQTSIEYVVFNFNRPNITLVNTLNGPTEGGYNLTIYGDDFGITGDVLIGSNECDIFQYDHQRIICSVPPGTGRGHEVLIESGLNVNQKPRPLFHYDAPIINSVFPVDGTTRGGENLTVTGFNFGSDPTNIRLTLGERLCLDCDVIDPSRIVRCLTPKGIGTNLPIKINVSGQTDINISNVSIVYNYDPPVIDSIFPNPMNAEGGMLTIFGDNFGSEETDPFAPGLHVVVSDDVCNDPIRINEREIICNMSNIEVGYHPIHLQVASQFVQVRNDTLFAACRNGMFGQPGEFCMSCPIGAFCLGYLDGQHHDPINEDGWGFIDRTTFEPCVPVEACLSDFKCAVGYSHVGPLLVCGGCSDGYYRREGLCIQCPELAWLILICYFLMAAFLCSVAYFLTKYGVQLAAVTIFIDFLQTFSLFSKYDFAWPSVVDQALIFASAFNLNLDIASPECSVDWGYVEKWYIYFTMPVLFGVIFTASSVVTFIRWMNKKLKRQTKHMQEKMKRNSRKKSSLGVRAKMLKKQSTLVGDIFNQGIRVKQNMEERKLLVDDDDMDAYDASFNRFIDAEFGAFLIMCYYLHMAITKKCLEIFQCGGPGNTLEAETSIICDPETSNEFRLLHLFASLGLFVYGIGIPGTIVYLLYKHRSFIMDDQHRRERALNIDETRAAKLLQSKWRGYYTRRMVDPRNILRRHKLLGNIGRTRAKYGKLYEDFTGNCYYWRIVLLLRKLLLVLIALFIDNKYRQTTLAFLVLFISYAAQVRYKPYLARYKVSEKKKKTLKAYKQWEIANHQRVSSKLDKVLHKMKRKVKAGANDLTDKSTMDMKQLVIHDAFAKAVVAKAKKDEEEAALTDMDKNITLDPVQRHWKSLKSYVAVKSTQKYKLRPDYNQELAEDAFLWIFDYNTLETLSLVTSMFVLLFGLLFDTYAELGNSVEVNLLAAITIFAFAMVNMIFLGSVYLDIYRKFFPGLYRYFFIPFLRRLKKLSACFPSLNRHIGELPEKNIHSKKKVAVAPDNSDSRTKAANDRGQWMSPVNPFATLEVQNNNLIKAEEARIAALVARKEKHAEELREREEKRVAEMKNLEEAFASRLKAVEEDLKQAEEEDMMDEENLENEMKIQLEQEATLIETEMKSKMDAVLGVSGVDKLKEQKLEESKKAIALLEETEFEKEKEMLEAELKALEEVKLSTIKANQIEDLHKTLSEIESEAETVFSGRRDQQEEIKARLHERKVKRTRFRRKAISITTASQEERLMHELEAKLENVMKKHEEELSLLKKELEHEKSNKITQLKLEIKARVEADHSSDNEFEKEHIEAFQKENEKVQSSIKKINEDLAKKVEGLQANGASEDDVKKIRAEAEVAINRLKAGHSKQRDDHLKKLEERRRKRLEMKQKADEERERERLQALEQQEKEAIDQKARLLEIEANTNGKDEAEIAKLKAEFNDAQAAEKLQKEKQKEERRLKLEEKRRKIKEAREAALKAKADLHLNVEDVDDDEKEEMMKKLKEEAENQRQILEESLRNKKAEQKRKLLERRAKKKAEAEERKKQVMLEKRKEEIEMKKKMEEEEKELRAKQQAELTEIEEARIEVFLDETQAEELAAGVAEWRERQKELNELKAQGPKRSDILKADFGSKARQLDATLKKLKDLAVALEERKDDEKLKENISNVKNNIARRTKELETIQQSYEEQVETEINQLTNDAAVEAARQMRRMKTLKDTTEFMATGKSTSDLIPSANKESNRMTVDLSKVLPQETDIAPSAAKETNRMFVDLNKVLPQETDIAPSAAKETNRMFVDLNKVLPQDIAPSNSASRKKEKKDQEDFENDVDLDTVVVI